MRKVVLDAYINFAKADKVKIYSQKKNFKVDKLKGLV